MERFAHRLLQHSECLAHKVYRCLLAEMWFQGDTDSQLGDLNSFSYCFEGLPMHSVVAVSGMGCMKSEDSFNRWCYGIQRLEEMRIPVLILVYGQEVEIPGLHTPIKFIPDFISTRLRKL